jgi:hypothetical protein
MTRHRREFTYNTPESVSTNRANSGKRQVGALGEGYRIGTVLGRVRLPQFLILGLRQLAIVGIFLPIAFALRSTWTYRRVLMAGGLAAIATIACVWLVERAFDCLFLQQSQWKSIAEPFRC